MILDPFAVTEGLHIRRGAILGGIDDESGVIAEGAADHVVRSIEITRADRLDRRILETEDLQRGIVREGTCPDPLDGGRNGDRLDRLVHRLILRVFRKRIEGVFRDLPHKIPVDLRGDHDMLVRRITDVILQPRDLDAIFDAIGLVAAPGRAEVKGDADGLAVLVEHARRDAVDDQSGRVTVKEILLDGGIGVYVQLLEALAPAEGVVADQADVGGEAHGHDARSLEGGVADHGDLHILDLIGYDDVGTAAPVLHDLDLVAIDLLIDEILERGHLGQAQRMPGVGITVLCNHTVVIFRIDGNVVVLSEDRRAELSDTTELSGEIDALQARALKDAVAVDVARGGPSGGDLDILQRGTSVEGFLADLHHVIEIHSLEGGIMREGIVADRDTIIGESKLGHGIGSEEGDQLDLLFPEIAIESTARVSVLRIIRIDLIEHEIRILFVHADLFDALRIDECACADGVHGFPDRERIQRGAALEGELGDLPDAHDRIGLHTRDIFRQAVILEDVGIPAFFRTVDLGSVIGSGDSHVRACRIRGGSRDIIRTC